MFKDAFNAVPKVGLTHLIIYLIGFNKTAFDLIGLDLSGNDVSALQVFLVLGALVLNLFISYKLVDYTLMLQRSVEDYVYARIQR